MVNLTASGDTIKFEFENSPHYLYNGTIEVPKNSLSMVMDDSEMVTFKKSASNDIFVSIRYSELGKTKNEMLSWYKDNMVKDYVDEGEVDEQIEEAIQNYFDGAEYDSDSKRINFKHGTTIKGYIDASDFVIDGMVDDVEIENGYLVITFNTDSGKQPISIPLTDIFNPNNYYDKTATDALLAAKADTATTYTKTEVDAVLSGKADTSAVTESINAAVSGKVDTSTFNTYSGSVETALSGKQDTLIAGENITISGNVISSEGGGKAVSAGTNISITTGETADTINCTLPITKIQGYNSVIIGDSRNTVNGDCNVAVGTYNSINKKDYSYTPEYCFVGGYYNNVYNSYETSFGKYNNSVQDTSVGGESGTTLFSVGNGTLQARHNAFEIRKNGDIYLTKDGQDVKLQDQLGGGNNVVTLTQAEYDALVDKDPTAFYIISDAEEIDLDNYYTKSETSGATQISTALNAKADTATTYSKTEVDAALSGKQDTLIAGSGITISGNVISAEGGGSITIDPSLDSGSTNAVANSAITTAINSKMDEVNYAYFYGNQYTAGLKGYYYDSQTETQTQKFDWGMVWQSDGSIGFDTIGQLTVFNKLDTSAITTSITSGSTDVEVPSAKAVYNAIQEGGGSITIDPSLDSGSTNAVANSAITTAINAKADTATTYSKTEVDAALSGKQDTLSAGTGIEISGNVISATGGGGGKAVSAGTNISITTGETADTINCTLPMSTDSVKKIVVDSNYSSFVTSDAVITADSLSNSILLGNNTFNIKGIIKGKINNNLIIGTYNTSQLTNGTKPALEGNLVVGSNNHINSAYSLLVGNNSTISSNYQFAVGYKQYPNNEFETSLGKYNASSSGSSTFGDSGNTLFSVGNGTAENARHNAFEIRQNGDIYCSDGTNDVKLQDTITATAANTTALGGLSLVKLTQAQYDALETKDNSTLYVIIN